MSSNICSLRGFHGIIVVIPDGQRKDSLKHLHAFLTKVLDALNSCQPGLSSTTIALVADKTIHSTCRPLGGEWLTLSEVTPLLITQQQTRGGKHRRSAEKVGVHVSTLDPLERAIQALEKAMLDSDGVDQPREQSCYTWGAMATQLHSLLDTTPWRPQDHTELSLYLLVSESEDIPSPDSAVALYSALERLQTWDRGHVTITCDSPVVESKMCLWSTVLKSPSAVLTNSWSPPVGVFWRGSVHFTEHKTFHDAYLNTAVFQGFALSLMDRTMSSSVAMVMEGVGLDPRKPFIPTHLEVVQILDVSSVPHFLLSPLQCTLYPCSLVNPQHTNSAQLFRQWFTRRSSQPDHVGFLMRLCSVERRDGARRITSADWSNHILTRDLPLTATAVPSALDCYQPGPMILVCPGDSSNTLSCDSWFLWQHKALRMYLMKDLCPVVPVVQKVDTGISIHDTCSGLPLLKLRTDSTVEERNGEFADIDSAQFWKTVSGTKCEVDLSPSEWPEMQAMKTHEWIQRKLAHKSKTPDLLFGQPFPPPPSTTPENHLCVGSVLECFADDGSPMVHELSPVALQDPANMVKISDPNEVDISFESIAGTTPTSKKLIHGIHYCLTVDDLAMDARLQRLQQRCLSSERASHCFSSNTPLQERRHRLRTLEENPTLSDAGPTGHESTGSGTRNICSGQKHEGPVTRPVHARLGAKVGAVPPVRRGTKRKLNLRPQVPFDHGMGSTGNGVGSKMATRTDNDIQEGSPLVAGITEVTGQDVDKRSQHMQEEGSANGSEFNYPSTRTENGDMDIRGAEKENTKESRKKLLEKTIVAVLKGNMPRDHPCFRLCYNRLFNLCKTFLKDVRNPEQFADEMERTVNFNVKQVIEFELRQAGLDLSLIRV